MPIFEYHCEDCSREFELLTRVGEEALCPGCQSARLRKKWSTFAAQGGGKAAPVPAGHAHGAGCGCCGGGAMDACGLN